MEITLMGGFVVQSQILMFNYSERSSVLFQSIFNVHKSDGEKKNGLISKCWTGDKQGQDLQNF